MIDWSKNKNLWRDEESFNTFNVLSSSMMILLSNEKYEAKYFQEISNALDDLMQKYEKDFGPIEDPLFFFAFASANAFFLQINQKYDELGSKRKAYIINGYKEGLTKHVLYPSYDNVMLQLIDDNFPQFTNEYDKDWYEQNRKKFVPVMQ